MGLTDVRKASRVVAVRYTGLHSETRYGCEVGGHGGKIGKRCGGI